MLGPRRYPRCTHYPLEEAMRRTIALVLAIAALGVVAASASAHTFHHHRAAFTCIGDDC